jgi:hypothetical protein
MMNNSSRASKRSPQQAPGACLTASGFERCSRTSKDRGNSCAKGKAQPPDGIIAEVRVVPLSKGISKGMIPRACKRLAEVEPFWWRLSWQAAQGKG